MEYAVIDGQRVALTEWFPANVKPVHVGVYQGEMDHHCPKWYRFWDGKDWYVGDRWPDGAEREFANGNKVGQPYGSLLWRGLSHPPGAT